MPGHYGNVFLVSSLRSFVWLLQQVSP